MKRKILTVTERAAERIKYLLEQRDKASLGIRVSVKSGGCSGLSYIIEYADSKADFDEVVEALGVNIIIDPKAIMFLLGTQMDYIEDKFKSGFIFNNPNEKGKCGCGESFHV